MRLYKLYAYALGDDPDPPVRGRDGLLPRVCTRCDADAISWARALVACHDEVCCFELVEINRDGSNGRTVIEESVATSPCRGN